MIEAEWYVQNVQRNLFHNVNLNTVQNALANLGFSGVKEEDLSHLYGVDLHEEELVVMAETAAYFHVAYKVRQFYQHLCS